MENEAVPIPRPRRKLRAAGNEVRSFAAAMAGQLFFAPPDGRQKWQGGFRTKDDAQWTHSV